jgi:outer membrane protein assembly factor BamB
MLRALVRFHAVHRPIRSSPYPRQGPRRSPGALWRRTGRGLAALALVGAGWLLPATAQVARADGPQPNAPWAQQKGDGSRTGRSTLTGPAVPTAQAWRYVTNNPIVSGPVVAPDGMIYFGTENFRVWALRPDGTQRWVYELPGTGNYLPPSYLLLDHLGHVVFGTDNGYVIGLQTDVTDSNPKEAWQFDTRNAPYGTVDPQSVRAAPGASDNTGRTYFGTEAGTLYELDNGSFAGVHRAEGEGAVRAGAAVTPDGTVIWGNARGSLYGDRSSGGNKWRVVLDGAISTTPATGGDSTTYVATDAGSVFAITTDGQQRWRVSPSEGKPLRGAPSLGPDGTIYVGADNGRLYALDPASGATKWSFATQGPLTAAATVGADGLIYLGSNDSRLYVLAPDGRLQTDFQMDGPIDRASPAIGAGGTLYVGTRSGTLYALKSGTPSTPSTPPPATTTPPPATGEPGVATAAAPPGFSFVRCATGRVYALTADRTIGAYVTDPAAIGTSPILQSSDTVPPEAIAAVCGSGR